MHHIKSTSAIVLYAVMSRMHLLGLTQTSAWSGKLSTSPLASLCRPKATSSSRAAEPASSSSSDKDLARAAAFNAADTETGPSPPQADAQVWPHIPTETISWRSIWNYQLCLKLVFSIAACVSHVGAVTACVGR